jgi:hypothetical protein
MGMNVSQEELARWEREGLLQPKTLNKAIDALEPSRLMPEKEWMWKCIHYAEANGWKHYHTLNSVGSEAGFPDSVFVGPRIVYVEWKSEKGKLTAAQEKWLEAIRKAGGEAYCFRPSDWPEVQRILRQS